MIKVLHVITRLNGGGAYMMLCKLLETMDKNRFQSAVISLMPGGEVDKRLMDAGIPIFRLAMQRNSIPSAQTVLNLRKYTRAFDPDIIQGWTYHGDLAALLSKVLLKLQWSTSKKRVVIWNIRHSLSDLNNERKMTRVLIRVASRLSRHIDCIISNSRLSIRQHCDIGYCEKGFNLIPNGFDCDRFKPSEETRNQVRTKYKIPYNGIVIGMVARLHPMKGHTIFLNAASCLLASYPDVYFLIAGPEDTIKCNALQNMICKSGIQDHVKYIGNISNPEQLYPAFDIMTLPSLWGEGFSNVIGEAMACEIPCIATDIGDVNQLVGNTGIIIKPNDPLQLASAWKHLIELSPENIMVRKRSARSRILSRYTLSHVTQQYEEIYQRTLVHARF